MQALSRHHYGPHGGARSTSCMPLMITTMVLQLLLLAGVLTFIAMRPEVLGRIKHHGHVQVVWRVEA